MDLHLHHSVMSFLRRRKTTDTSNFEDIVVQYQDRLFRFVYMRLGIRETAEDVVQEVFIRLFKTLAEGKVVDNYESFLYRSVNNACIDYYRKYKYKIVDIDENSSVSDTDDRDIEEEYIRMRKLLDDLPYEQAETIRLKCYDGLTFRQIAEISNIPEATVKSRYRYAIQHLRKQLI